MTTGVYPVSSRSRTQLALDVMPFVLMAAVTVVAVMGADSAGVLPLLSLGPAFAALAGGPRYTLITGCVAVILCAAIASATSLSASRQDSLAFATVAGVTLAGVIASAGRQRRERELADVTAIAEATQQVLLRPVPQQLGALRLAVRYMSAASGARIGGDLYEVVPTTAGLRLIIGDVQGKGLAAVQTAATVLGAFREAAHDAPTLDVIIERIEASLARQGDGEQFVTAILAQVCHGGPAIELLNCGHPPPLLVSGGTERFLEPSDPGLPLGLAGLAVLPREPVTFELGAGDSVLFYTDGISEARNKHGDFFPLKITGSKPAAGPGANGGPAAGPDAMLERLSNDVVRHVGHAIDDDAAMLLLQHDPAGNPGEAGPAGVSRVDGSRRYAPGKTGPGTGRQSREEAGGNPRWRAGAPH